MQIRIVIFICCILLGNTAIAELPRRGELMDSVQAEYGTPARTSTVVGEPPITRWYYESFTVVFEYEHVIHAFPRNISVENLSTNNTDGLVLPDATPEKVESETNEPATAEAETRTEKKPEVEDTTPLGNSFFENTPDLIR